MDLIYKMIRFGLVGLLGMGIDFSVTWFCKETLRINKYVANSLGFTTAAICNFFLNMFWTFNASSTNEEVYFIKFIIISLVGLGLNNLFIYLFNSRLSLNFYLSKLIAVGLVFIWNFAANNYFNFH
jgi:putative flippase GtrA